MNIARTSEIHSRSVDADVGERFPSDHVNTRQLRAEFVIRQRCIIDVALVLRLQVQEPENRCVIDAISLPIGLLIKD